MVFAFKGRFLQSRVHRALRCFLGPLPGRLLQINSGKVYAVFTVKEGIDHLNDSYWTLRAEPVPEPEVAIMCADNLPPEGLSEAPEALGMNVSASQRLLQVRGEKSGARWEGMAGGAGFAFTCTSA